MAKKKLADKKPKRLRIHVDGFAMLVPVRSALARQVRKHAKKRAAA